ncbi:InlB B-repeat-containing protein [Paenibacillus luteus]|uniref:InlB B-repeat-containing protein n=1 Tax=Paenibacillus luteus TaxID=2545753 RepID=UPI0011434C24|nr:InlB B-repeat-containing protein [Paenibacillus luteus]
MKKCIAVFVAMFMLVQLVLPSVGVVGASSEGTTNLTFHKLGNGTSSNTGTVSPEGTIDATKMWLNTTISSLVADDEGNIYFIRSVADGRIYKVDSSGMLSTYAGLGKIDEAAAPYQAYEAGKLATETYVYQPTAMTLDRQGHLYVQFLNQPFIMKIDADTKLTSFAFGSTGHLTTQNGQSVPVPYEWQTATPTAIEGLKMPSAPNGITTDAAGDLYFSIRQDVTVQGSTASVIFKIADGKLHYIGQVEQAIGGGIAVDLKGQVYAVAPGPQNQPWQSVIWKFVKSEAFPGRYTSEVFASSDGKGNANLGGHHIWQPTGIGIDANDNIYVSEGTNRIITKIDKNNSRTVWAGIAVNTGVSSGTVAHGGVANEQKIGNSNGQTKLYTVTPSGVGYFMNLSKVFAIEPGVTLSYDGSGASGGSAPATNGVKVGAKATIAGNTGNMFKNFHTFGVWNDQADGNGTDYTAGTSIELTASKQLYAKWVVNQYQLIYRAGSNGTLTKGEQSGEASFTLQVPYNTKGAKITAVANQGYEFTGWDDGVVSRDREDTALFDRTRTANFVKLHTVSFNTDGGTAIQPVTIRNDMLLPAISDPTRTGYWFDGWYTDEALTQVFDASKKITADLTLRAKWSQNVVVSFNTNQGSPIGASTLVYNTLLGKIEATTKVGHTFAGWYTDKELTQAFDAEVPITSNLTLHAKWEINKYAVSFVVNDGSTVQPQTIAHGQPIHAALATTTRTGYTFLNWYVDEELTEPFETETPVTSGLTLYAKWALNTYTVSFESNDGTAVASKGVAHDGVLGTIETTTKAGHTFAGWYTDKELTQAFDANAPIKNNVTLYAKWTINTYKVNFVVNGGSAVEPQVIVYNAFIDKQLTKTDRAGHAFTGWYVNAELTEAADTDEAITSDVTLYAKWTINTYKVDFVVNGGSVVQAQTIAYNQPINNGLVVNQPGHTFAGWYIDQELTQVFNMTTPITKDMTLYAKWTINTYKVNFVVNGGSAVEPQAIVYNAFIDKQLAKTDRAGHTFTGWYVNAELTKAADTDKAITSDVTLYAKWTINIYTVSFETNDGTEVATQEIAYNKLLDAQQLATTKDKHTFIGWYTDEELKQAFAATTPITGDLTLYAMWVVTPPGAPSITAISASDAGIDLQWTAVEDVTGYVVYQSTVAGAKGERVAELDADTVSYQAVSLTNGTTYYYTVAAVNDGGGIDSVQVHATPKGVPAAPANVQAVAGNEQVTLSFTSPAHNGGSEIVEYIVTILPDDTTLKTTDTSVVVTGLTNGKAYRFTVIAVNAQGNSAASESSAAVTPSAPPTDGGGNPSTGGNSNPPTGGNSTPNPVTTTNGKLEIAAGAPGNTKYGEEVQVKIPAGATAQSLKLTVEVVTQLEGLNVNGEVFASSVYELLKNFTDNFRNPITLTFKFDQSQVKANQHPEVFYFNEESKQWIRVGGEVTGNMISVDVDHFTKFAVLVVDNVTDIPDNQPNFTDIAGHWAEASIKDAVQRGIVLGYTDGTFRPHAQITRAEFATMLAGALQLKVEGTALAFTDEAEIAAWAKTAIAHTVAAGITVGYADGSFRPSASISRAELTVMIARASGKEATATTTSFADDQDIPVWAKASVQAAKEAGIVNGLGQNRFAPQMTATRAEAIVMILNLLEALS